jgi:hypothetical protein
VTPQRDKNWCDRCEQVHTDIKSVHCAIGEHCTHTTETCAIDDTHDDHGRICCDCGTNLSERYRAQTDTSDSPAAQVRRRQTY